MKLTVTFKCVSCEKKETLNSEEAKERSPAGTVMCMRCFMPMVATKANAK